VWKIIGILGEINEGCYFCSQGSRWNSYTPRSILLLVSLVQLYKFVRSDDAPVPVPDAFL
jgi:hypothetical protein